MRYKRDVLKNGIRLITVPMKDNPTVTVMIGVNVGAAYEDRGNNGISHFLEHLNFKGTTNRSSKDITLELDGIGASYNAFTSYEVTGYWAKAGKKHFKKILNVVSDIYLNSIIPEEELEKERGVILEEINMYLDNKPRMAIQNILGLMYPKSAFGMNILGPKENIKKLKREDFIAYRDKWYKGKGTTIVVAGDIKSSEVKKEVEKIFEEVPAGKLSKPPKVIENQKKVDLLIDNTKCDQTHLVLGFRTFGMKHKDLDTLKVIRGILSSGMSSRLFSIMREELGICYYCSASLDNSFDHGSILIRAGVGNERVEEAISGILNILRDLKDKGVDVKELKKVKTNMSSKIMMNLETSEDLADFYSDQEISLMELKKPNEIIKDLNSVTAKDVQRVAKKIFVEKNMNLSIVGPHKDSNTFKKLLKI